MATLATTLAVAAARVAVSLAAFHALPEVVFHVPVPLARAAIDAALAPSQFVVHQAEADKDDDGDDNDCYNPGHGSGVEAMVGVGGWRWCRYRRHNSAGRRSGVE
jgi:hypothetical protein